MNKNATQKKSLNLFLIHYTLVEFNRYLESTLETITH